MHETRRQTVEESAELATLIRLNDEYIRAVQRSDVGRFRELLSEDFVCSLSDGSKVNREEFLKHTEAPATISDLAAHDVVVRLMGDVAIVHARTTFSGPGGRDGKSRYTDVWAKRAGRWVAVAAHITRY